MSENRRWWVSWWCLRSEYGKFELHWPWWISGQRWSDDALSICAAVIAPIEGIAKEIILASYDTRPNDLDWRMCNIQAPDWEPFNDRFQRAAWMKWPTVAENKP